MITPFQPGDMLWRYLGETRAILGLPGAALMQAMHPMIGAAVGEHSVVFSDPWGRARRSLDSVATWVYGGSSAIEEGQRLREMHKQFSGVDEQGRKYHALNGEAYAWVHLSAHERLMSTYRMFGRPFDRYEEKRLYTEVLRLGQILQVPPQLMPQTVGEYWEYYDDMVANKLENHPTVHKVLESTKQPMPPSFLPDLLGPAAARALAPSGSFGHFVIVGTLPPEIREILGLRWTAREELRFRRFASTVRTTFPRLPERLRYVPKAYDARRTGTWRYGLPAAS